MSRRTRGAAVYALLLAGTVSACSDPVDLESPELDTADQEACAALVDGLPATLNEQEPREVEPADVPGAAYGDPALVVTCGVAVPSSFDKISICEEVNDVGWYAPPEQYDDQDVDVTLYAVSYRPLVELKVAADYRPDGLAAALTELAGPISDNLELVRSCI